MASPFPPNATLTFQLPTGSREIDALGNPTNTTEDLVISVYLKESKNRGGPGNDAIDGGELSKLHLEGRVVGKVVDGVVEDLPALPAAILPGAKAIAIVGSISGEFFLEATVPSAFGVDDVLGGKIRGYLVTQVAWGEAL